MIECIAFYISVVGNVNKSNQPLRWFGKLKIVKSRERYYSPNRSIEVIRHGKLSRITGYRIVKFSSLKKAVGSRVTIVWVSGVRESGVGESGIADAGVSDGLDGGGGDDGGCGDYGLDSNGFDSGSRVHGRGVPRRIVAVGSEELLCALLIVSLLAFNHHRAAFFRDSIGANNGGQPQENSDGLPLAKNIKYSLRIMYRSVTK